MHIEKSKAEEMERGKQEIENVHLQFVIKKRCKTYDFPLR